MPGFVVWPRSVATIVLDVPTSLMLFSVSSHVHFAVCGVVKQRSKKTSYFCRRFWSSISRWVVGNSGWVTMIRLTPASWAALITGSSSAGLIDRKSVVEGKSVDLGG